MGHTEYEIVIPLLISSICKVQIIFIEIQWSTFSTPLTKSQKYKQRLEKNVILRSMFIVQKLILNTKGILLETC